MHHVVTVVFGVMVLAGSVLRAVPALASEGLVSKKSAHGVGPTLDRLEKALKEAGVTVAARIDHASAAKDVGQSLRPTALLLFANPKQGTPLMQANQTIGIDLPLKALAWEDDKGQVWLTYNDPSYLASRHGITQKGEAFEVMRKALDRLSDAATQP